MLKTKPDLKEGPDNWLSFEEGGGGVVGVGGGLEGGFVWNWASKVKGLEEFW